MARRYSNSLSALEQAISKDSGMPANKMLSNKNLASKKAASKMVTNKEKTSRAKSNQRDLAASPLQALQASYDSNQPSKRLGQSRIQQWHFNDQAQSLSHTKINSGAGSSFQTSMWTQGLQLQAPVLQASARPLSHPEVQVNNNGIAINSHLSAQVLQPSLQKKAEGFFTAATPFSTHQVFLAEQQQNQQRFEAGIEAGTTDLGNNATRKIENELESGGESEAQIDSAKPLDRKADPGFNSPANERLLEQDQTETDSPNSDLNIASAGDNRSSLNDVEVRPNNPVNQDSSSFDSEPTPSDNFLAELDKITQRAQSQSSSNSQAKSSLPKNLGQEVDSFQQELNSVLGNADQARGDNENTSKQGAGASEQNQKNASPYHGTSQGLSDHGFFDSLGKSSQFSNTFNLGKVNVGQHFDRLDLNLEEQERRTQNKIAEDLGLDHMDILADLDHISQTASASQTTATDFTEDAMEESEASASETATESAMESALEETAGSEATQKAELNTKPIQDSNVSTHQPPLRTEPSGAEQVLDDASAHVGTTKHQAPNYGVPLLLSSSDLSPWSAAAAMLVAWQSQWPVQALINPATNNGEATSDHWSPYRPLLNAGDEAWQQWGIEAIGVPQDFNDWQQQLTTYGPLILASADQVLVLCHLGEDTRLNSPSQGELTVSFEDFEELLVRMQMQDNFKLAALKLEDEQASSEQSTEQRAHPNEDLS